MPLTPGTRLGPYEIQSPLGAGGMGEVYRGRDTRLDRSVAIKILPAHFSFDPTRKQRFEREAKTISSLNHPHICVLHDIGSQDGIDYLIMECVEGETLAKRLEKGPLPFDQVLKYGAQIADALDKAHRSGVIHRDLKPGNIMLTPSGAKLLDFGLAKTAIPLSTAATMTVSASVSPVTEHGTVVGTFQYMSPEQVEGKELDGRSDIFSLGAVLYEMLTGHRAFEGKSQLSVASAILEKEPLAIHTIKPMTPPALDHAIRKCLAKSSEDRWQSAADIKHEINWISQSSADGLPGFSVRSKKTLGTAVLTLGLGVMLVVLIGVGAKYLTGHRETPGPIVRATLILPTNVTLLTLGDQGGAPAISPDGTNLVFVGVSDQQQMLFLRRLDSASAKPLTGTEGGKFPFWSSDGKSIAFFANQQLKRLDLAGGPPLHLAPAPDARGGTWAGDVILFTPNIYEEIYRVPATGGKPIPVTTLDRSQHTTHRWPHFLPDGKHFLYLAANHISDNPESSAIYAASIDGGIAKQILQTNAQVLYSSGNLLYFRDGSLMAQPFDVNHLRLEADAAPIGQVLRENGNWGMMASASETGVLIFQGAGAVSYPVIWFDRSGHSLGPVPISVQVSDLRLSPDGTRAGLVGFDGAHGVVYVSDLKTGAKTRLTFAEDTWFLSWSPDGSRVAYSAQRVGTKYSDIFIKRADGAGERELLLASDEANHPTDWTRNGQYIVLNRGDLGSQRIWILPMFGDRKAFPLFPNSTFDHFDGRVSPDGKWIAYMSRESGVIQLYVTSFPNGVGKWQISSETTQPDAVWRADGKELYFVSQGGNMIVASIQESAGSITVGEIRPLFHSLFLNTRVRAMFDVDSKEGRRFLGSVSPDTSTLPLNVITNWTEELKKK
jgi:Tol biopolymer transport system component